MRKRELQSLLRECYEKWGPRRGVRVVPPEEFAAMTDEQVNQWNFDNRFFMRRVAQGIVAP